MVASAIWFTDRSRFETGTGRCAMQRYLRYHAGPTGYGYTTRSQSVPLSTGTATHTGLEGLAQILRLHDRLPTQEEVRAIIGTAREKYEKTLTAKGFRGGGLYSGPVVDETIREQSALIHGLIWTMALRFFPWLHQHYKVLQVEEERLHFTTCTCGAGPLPQADHDARGCQGRALMIRTDILGQHRVGSQLAYFEGKTTGWESDAWAEQWETKPQLGLGTLDLERKYGQEVSEIYIVGMQKGARKKDEGKTLAEGDPLQGMRRQQSALCYGYRRPANPPLAREDWVPSYEWVNEAGEVKRKSKAHTRAGVWEIAKGDWPLWLAYHADDPELTPEEFWARQLPASVLDKIVFVLGPMNRQDTQLKSLLTCLDAEEAHWQDTLWQIYEYQQQPGCGWGSPNMQAMLDRWVPRSWECRRYGKEHQCEFIPICFKHSGWQDPTAMGFIPRRPHHAPELQQAIDRGLLVAESEEFEEEER
jgi:hypothetical protein